jgi:hypothetical protein
MQASEQAKTLQPSHQPALPTSVRYASAVTPALLLYVALCLEAYLVSPEEIVELFWLVLRRNI